MAQEVDGDVGRWVRVVWTERWRCGVNEVGDVMLV